MARSASIVRSVLGWTGVIAVLIGVLTQSAGGAQEPDVAEGARLYAANCAVCHGTRGEGVTGDGPDAGPALRGAAVALVDLTMRTGRMPILEPRVGLVRDPQIGDEERAAIVTWMHSELELTGGIPDVAAGDVARGGDLYARHCAACHGSTGAGGISAGGTLVRAVRGVDRVGVVEAIRAGPFEMPAFGEAVIDDRAAADIAAFTDHLVDAPTTPLGLAEVDRVTMSALVIVLVLAAVGVMLLTARPVPFPNAEDDDRG